MGRAAVAGVDVLCESNCMAAWPELRPHGPFGVRVGRLKRLTWFLRRTIVTWRSEQMDHSQVYCHAATTERLRA